MGLDALRHHGLPAIRSVGDDPLAVVLASRKSRMPPPATARPKLIMRRGPMRLVAAPEIGDSTIMTATSGTSARPVRIAE